MKSRPEGVYKHNVFEKLQIGQYGWSLWWLDRKREWWESRLKRQAWEKDPIYHHKMSDFIQLVWEPLKDFLSKRMIDQIHILER